jgi:hypothetical protein
LDWNSPLPDRFREEKQAKARAKPLLEGTMYALFEGNKQIGNSFRTEKEVWEAALIEGLVPTCPLQMRKAVKCFPTDIASSACSRVDRSLRRSARSCTTRGS